MLLIAKIISEGAEDTENEEKHLQKENVGKIFYVEAKAALKVVYTPNSRKGLLQFIKTDLSKKVKENLLSGPVVSRLNEHPLYKITFKLRENDLF